jgi:sarcosine oxidase
MSSNHYDAIVLGTGGVGSSTLLELTRRGLKVLGLDRFPPAHDKGSSHGETRMIRQSYFEHPDYVPLLKRAYTLWDKLDPQLLVRSGVYYIGPEQGDIITGVRESARRYQLKLDTVDPAADKCFYAPTDCSTIFEPEAGYLPVEQCIELQLSMAVEAGAEHRWGEAIQGWSQSAQTFEVRTDTQSYSADHLVVAGGSWANPLMPDLKLPLRILRKHLHWFEAEQLQLQSGFFFELEHGQFYGFPTLDGLLKVGEHSGGEEISDALAASREPDAVDLERVSDFVKTHFPGAGQEVKQAVCFYTMTPDSQFIVDHHPASKRVAFAAGLSGHGFKFTPVLGEILADLVLEGGTDFDIDFLSASRSGLDKP